MTTGLLWWCTKPNLIDNIQAAMERYEKKYGRRPELCLVHPDMLKDVKLEGLKDITVPHTGLCSLITYGSASKICRLNPKR